MTLDILLLLIIAVALIPIVIFLGKYVISFIDDKNESYDTFYVWILFVLSTILVVLSTILIFVCS